MFDVPRDRICVTRGEDHLGMYTFITGVAKHRFCKACGIHVFHHLRSDPQKVGVNGACLPGRGRFDHDDMPVHDGAENHPKDTGASTRNAGILSYRES